MGHIGRGGDVTQVSSRGDHGGAGQDDGQGEGGDHDPSREEAGEVLDSFLVLVPLGHQGGEGEEDVEHGDPEGAPVAELRQGAGENEEQKAEGASEGQRDQGLDTSHGGH